jgi:phage terminase large subunit
MFIVGPLFHEVRKCELEGNDICVLQGGTDSGKTVAAIQYLLTIAATTRAPLMDPIITILNESVPNSKKGAYRVAKQFYDTNDHLRRAVKEWREGDRVAHFKSGWTVEFLGATDEQNAKQGKRQYLFANEANGIDWLIFWQMAKRTRVMTIIDYNPNVAFWAHENLIDKAPDQNDLGAKVKLLISDHRHNPFISEKDHAKTENIKDPDLHRIYARGLTGSASGLIFKTWQKIPDKQFPWELPKFGALDFGYSIDPTAGIRFAVKGNNIYMHELCYKPGITPTQLYSLFVKANNFNEDEDEIYCEHDPDMIRQLKELGLLAIPARKGDGSIRAGILMIQKEYNVYYTQSSTNIDYEVKKYEWQKDKATGKPLNKPTEIDNHLMDASRYGIYTHFYRDAA